jgi:hypothetical protein
MRNIDEIKQAAAAEPERVFRLAGFADQLNRKGNRLTGLCPFHDDRNPSFVVFADGGWRCFGCKESGDVIDFRRKVTGKSLPEAVEDLAHALGIAAPAQVEPRRKPRGRKHETVYAITDPQTGVVIAEHVRVEYPDDLDPKTGKPKKDFFWRRDGKPGLGGLKTADLPLYRPPSLADPPPDSIVVLVEGEKAAEALAAHGLFAVGTVTGAGNPIPGDAALEFLRPYRVAFWPDEDPEGAGHMDEIAARLLEMEVEVAGVDWQSAPPKGDAADFFEAGGTAEGVNALVQSARPWTPSSQAVPSARPQERTSWTAGDLLRTEFEPPRWAVEGFLPEGLTVLGGRPKKGKSVLALQTAGAVSTGRDIFGVKTKKDKVLYLCLEDHPRRLKSRMRKQAWPADADCEIELSWPVFDKGGMAALAKRLRQRQYKLVIVDTLARFLGGEKDFNDYAVMGAAVAHLQRLALDTGTPLLVVTHTTKIGIGDGGAKILGSTAITAVADGFVLLEEAEGRRGWTLFVEGRDVDQFELSIKRDPLTLTWHLAEGAEGVRAGSLQEQVLQAIDAAGGSATCKEIADALGKDKALVHRELSALVQKGLVAPEERQGKEVPYRRILPA